jgi:hypothetical protein
MHVLLVLQERAVQRRDQLARIALPGISGDMSSLSSYVDKVLNVIETGYH